MRGPQFSFPVRLLLACSLLLLSAHGWAITLAVSGLSDELEENVRLSVGEAPKDPRLTDLWLETLPLLTRDALSALGYYSPEIEVKRQEIEGTQIVSLIVDAGDPVRINKVIISVTGEAQIDAGYMPVLGKIPLRRNAIFNSGDYETAKGVLIDAAQARGYFDFKLVTRNVLVSRRGLTADIRLIADSGPRYHFGDINFEQDTFNEDFLSRWVPFASNDPYEAGKLSELTQNLQNSGYFSSVRVIPERSEDNGTLVPIRVTLVTTDKNQVGIGLGFATDTGPRTKFTWGKPLINRRGHSADMALNLSQSNQEVSFAYRIPRDNQPLYNYWGLEYGLQRKDDQEEDIESLLSSLKFQRVRRFSSDWQESLFIRWERERSTIARVESTTDLVLPGFSYSRSRSKGTPFPTWGQSSRLVLMYGNKKLLSTIDFFKTVVNFKYLKAVSERNTLIFALQYGGISTNDFDRVPATQRFFAGGDRSVRGYKYRQLSPRNLNGDAVGGRYLEVGSVEYNYRISHSWSVALFVDSGRAFNNFSASQSIGAGFGIRWQSPVGPFRLDIATPVDDPDNDDIRLHLSLGPDL